MIGTSIRRVIGPFDYHATELSIGQTSLLLRYALHVTIGSQWMETTDYGPRTAYK